MRKIDFSNQDYKLIVDMYQKGALQKEIAEKYNCSASTISSVLRKYNVLTRLGGSKNTPDVIQKWIEMYLDGALLKDIALEFDVNATTVSKHLKLNGIDVDRYTYHFDEHYFDIIDTQEKAYYMGMLWADGHNCIERGSIIIELQEQDAALLEKLNALVKNERPIRRQNLHDKNPNWQNQYRLVLQSKYTSNVLESYGMFQNKSLVLTFPSWLNKSLYASFIRGYFDGDGCITLQSSNHNRSAMINMVGTKMFLEKVSDIIQTTLDVGVSIERDKRARDPICILRCSKRDDVVKILNWLYCDANIYMQRKYDKYQQFLNNINNSCCA